MRVAADPNRCVGAGQCVLTEPAVFDQNEDDGTVVVLIESPTGDELTGAIEAAHVCPSRALSVTE
jgi:ferredoxin